MTCIKSSLPFAAVTSLIHRVDLLLLLLLLLLFVWLFALLLAVTTTKLGPVLSRVRVAMLREGMRIIYLFTYILRMNLLFV